MKSLYKLHCITYSAFRVKRVCKAGQGEKRGEDERSRKFDQVRLRGIPSVRLTKFPASRRQKDLTCKRAKSAGEALTRLERLGRNMNDSHSEFRNANKFSRQTHDIRLFLHHGQTCSQSCASSLIHANCKFE